MKKETPILINGRVSKLRYRESRSNKKDDVKIFTLEMVTIIDELLKGSESDFKYLHGITTLNTLTSWDEPRLKIKRLSNKIIELRKVIPKSAILTFRDFNNSKDEWKYGVIKDREVINFLVSLKQEILNRITNHTQKQNPTKKVDR
ncbi:hypothetical protein [Aliarcobacter butzleri]|uniref:Uncharacterized protein n=1 Tax=Aliarcobacter butzleri L351 TaxID=1447259 RepID=A0A837J5R2_9BACT|nr:hypothetical protein [Aliarcobacter butzleri]KLE00939.1 hypothetical protein AF76_05715 [Aliarcobacter butzleri L351]KLE12847.1 hypothetical protein AF75_06720 [Aliarcobacter butzleri L350]